MARYKCPSCGAAYNGQKCGSCLYERFTEEIAHGNHTHKGEPLVVKAPVRQPIPRKDPFGCEPKTRKKARKKSRRPGLSFLILCLVFLSPILTRLLGTVAVLDDFVSTVAVEIEPEPEPVLPDGGLILNDSSDILVIADWQEGQEFGDGFSVYIQNDSRQDVAVSARDIVVNGYLMEYTHLYCNAEKSSIGIDHFYLDETDLRNTGIGPVEEISFWLEIYDTDDYETIEETPVITLTFSVPNGAASSSVFFGIPIWEQDGIQVSCLGYAPDDYSPEDFSEGTLLFHLENTTDRYLNFSTAEACLDGDPVDISLWCQLPPQTRAVTSVYLYNLEDMGIGSLKEMGELTFQLEIYDRDDYGFDILTDPIYIPAA